MTETNLFISMGFAYHFFPEDFVKNCPPKLRELVNLAYRLEDKDFGLKADVCFRVLNPGNPYVIFPGESPNDSGRTEQELIEEVRKYKLIAGDEKSIIFRDAATYLRLFKELKAYTDYG